MADKKSLVIHKIFEKTALAHAADTALQVKNNGECQRFTYGELESLSVKIAAFLINEGYKKGDAAVIILENRPEWGIIYLGVMFAGLIAVPLDPQLGPQEILNLVSDSNAKVLFSSQEIFTQKITPEIQENIGKIAVLDAQGSCAGKCVAFARIANNVLEALPVFPEVEPEDTASLIYTSGTTAQPKGVLLTHKNICSNFNSIVKLNVCLPCDNILSILPLYHTYSFMVTLMLPLCLGAKVTYCPQGFKPEELSRIIKEERVSVVVGVPRLYTILYNAITEKIRRVPGWTRFFLMPVIRGRVRQRFGNKLRLFVSGGARLEPKIGEALSRYFGIKIIEGYGLTETSPVATFNPLNKNKFGSVGKPIPDVEIKILNPDKDRIGEVLIKGPNVMQGYFKDPELTKTAIKDGWFYTGDLGYLDREGYLYLVGREKEIIVLGSGKNIYPEELEEYYLQAPSIKEICIISRKEKSFGQMKETLFAVILPQLEYFKHNIDSDIRLVICWDLETLSRNLPSYKHIMGFMLTTQELPRTALKKIKRFQVAEQFAGAKSGKHQAKEEVLSEEEEQLLQNDIARKIIQYLSKQVNKTVSLNSHLEIDLGIDSLSRVELAAGLEELFKAEVSGQMIYEITTVKELINMVSGLLNKPSAHPSGEKKDWAVILKQLPSKSTLDTERIEPRPIDWFLSWLLIGQLFSLLFRVVWFLRVRKRDNLPRQGPYLICPNHCSYMDGLFVACSLPLKDLVNTYFLGFYHVFRHPALSWSNKIARFIPLDNNVHLNEALQASAFLLSKNKIVCIFPEGMRSIDGKVKEFKKGAGVLIKELNVPVVPVYIKGSHEAWPRGDALPKPYPIKVTFGKPIYAQELLRRETGESGIDDYECIVRRLREEVIKLGDSV